MAKRKKTIIAGQIVKTIIYTAPEPLDGKRARAEKSRMTSAAQKAMNDRAARGRLEMLLAANFTGKDLFVTLTYRDEDLPPNRATAVKLLRGFIKTFRTHRKARDQELKYIYTTEEKHGEARLHHHLVINGTGADMEIIRSLWSYGDVVDMEHDVVMTSKLLTGDEESVYGDSGYLGADKREDSIRRNRQGRRIRYRINRRPSQIRKKPTRAQGQLKRREHEKSSIRAKVEHVFAVVKGRFRYRKTRYRGLRKQTAKLNMLFALANLILADRPCLAA